MKGFKANIALRERNQRLELTLTLRSTILFESDKFDNYRVNSKHKPGSEIVFKTSYLLS